MQFSQFNPNIPQWARENMKMVCDYCGSYILDNGDESKDHVITARKCANPNCVRHMAYRVEHLAKYYNVNGICPATAMTIIKERGFKSHLDIIPLWFPNGKPTERLGTIAELTCIEGYGSIKATRDLNCYASFDEYFSNCKNIEPVLWYNRDKLANAITYFNVANPLSKNKIYVMMTGSFNGYENRDDFLTDVNDAFGEIVQVIDVKKRKNNVHYLIREKNARDRSKTATAKEMGIPIVTPKEFVDILDGMTHK